MVDHHVTRLLPVVSATPSMAKGTASIKPTGGAEKAPLQDPRHGIWWGREGHFEMARRQDVKGGRVSATRGTHSDCMRLQWSKWTALITVVKQL